MGDVPAHDQAVTHHYLLHYPAHAPREGDPHYVDFEHFRHLHRPAARCYVGERIGFGECRDEHGNPAAPPAEGGEQPGLELHHAHIEFALLNAVDLSALEVDYPGVSNPDEVGAWVESAENLRWLCVGHHRGLAGAHSVAHSDWEAGQYVKSLIGGETDGTGNHPGN